MISKLDWSISASNSSTLDSGKLKKRMRFRKSLKIMVTIELSLDNGSSELLNEPELGISL